MRYLKAALAGIVLAAPAWAITDVARADRSNCSEGLERSYSKHYRMVRVRHGERAPGRYIRKLGVRFDAAANHRRGPWAIRDAKCSELRRSNEQLKALLYNPPAMVSRAVPPSQPPAGVKTDLDQAALPDCTWRPESGGSYSAYNSSSGAYGKYQIIPSTWAAHCSGIGRGPSGQEQCALRVYQAQGAGAWVNC
jgi:hypothetical protein